MNKYCIKCSESFETLNHTIVYCDNCYSEMCRKEIEKLKNL